MGTVECSSTERRTKCRSRPAGHHRRSGGHGEVCKPERMDEDEGRLELNAVEARVLGALIEKQLTTPDAYPLTLKALLAACNQTTNRDPITHLEDHEVEAATVSLKAQRLMRVVHPGLGERATKYRQVADEVLVLDFAERACVCVLLLRGPQTVQELKTRGERLHRFASLDEVEAALGRLARRDPPFVTRLERRVGQKEARWLQLLEADAESRAQAASVTRAAVVAGDHEAISQLTERVEAIEELVGRLIEALGDLVQLEDPPAD